MADFVPALTHQIKWSVGENRFDTEGKQPKQLSLFITKQSILELASYLQRLAGESSTAKVVPLNTATLVPSTCSKSKATAQLIFD